MLEYEKKFRSLGKTKVAGIDEVGRGPLCGPVVASSVILPDDIDIPGLTDSKKISPKKRIHFYDEILEKAISVGIGIINEDRIDEINILNATIEAMILSIEDLNIKPDFLLVDGNMKNLTIIPQESIVKGDSKSLSISAASVIAKVTRDRIMKEYKKLKKKEKSNLGEIKKLNSESIKSVTKAREKHPYGIYKKMRSKELKFSQINDIFGVRIITDSVDFCYRALGCIHNLYKPIPGRFKDYIAIPKSNGYQSLHTTVLGPHNLPLEFQIRTQEMDQLAQSGIAAHWLYKTTSSISKLSREQQWLNNLLDIQKQSGNPTEFLGSIKDDLNPGKVYVFSSKGEIIELPKKSTLIDFAYAIHTDLGNKYSSGKVDGEFKPPNTILKNGQRVVIEKSEIAKPDPSWLNFVTSVKARTSIRNYLRSIHESDAQKLGEKLLMSSLNEMEVSLNDVPSKTLNFILSEYKFKTIEELYVEIGLGNVIPKLIALRMAPSFKQDTSKTIYDIEGSEGLVMSYAKCCHPIPGDTIVGHITQGKGIVVHRSSCKSIRHIKRDKDNIELRWSENVDNFFSASIMVEVENIRGVLAQVSSVIAQSNHNIESVNYTDTHEAGHNMMVFIISVKSLNSLNKLIDKLSKIKNVYRVERKRS